MHAAGSQTQRPFCTAHAGCYGLYEAPNAPCDIIQQVEMMAECCCATVMEQQP